MSIKKEVNIGVIGLGWMGEVHSRGYNAIRDRFPECGFTVNLHAVAESSPARAEAAKKRFGFKNVFADWKDLVACKEIDAVDITAPNALHLELVKAVSKAEKHVLCEKPMGRYPEETLEAVQAARAAGVITAIGYNYRWAPVVQYLKQLIDSGKLGTITHYHGRFLNGYASDPLALFSWRFEKEQGLGTLGDLLVHSIDMAHMLAGPVTSVVSDKEIFIKQRPIPQKNSGTHYDAGRATDPMGSVTNEDYVNVLVRFANGARGIFEACRVINGAKCEMSFEIYGTKGCAKWNLEHMNQLYLQYKNESNPAEDGYLNILESPFHPYHKYFSPAPGIPISYDDLKTIEVFNFAKAVATGVQGEIGFDQAYAVARVQQAIVRSWNSGSWETVAA